MSSLVVNKKARMEFTPIEQFVAGIVLTGPEVKTLRLRRGSLAGSHIRVIGGEAFLVNAQFSPYPFSRQEEYDPTRMRKLLLTKKELLQLTQSQETKGLALIPLEIFLNENKIKVRLAIARGKQKHDMREELKRRDLERELRRR